MRQALLAASLGCALMLIINCSDSGGDDSSGFIDPGTFAPKAAYDTAYTITNGESCSVSAPQHCAAIVFSRDINDTRYSGFAVRDTHLAPASQHFFLKASWQGNLANGVYPMTISVYNAGNYYLAAAFCSVTLTYPATGIIKATLGTCNVNGLDISGSTIDGAYFLSE